MAARVGRCGCRGSRLGGVLAASIVMACLVAAAPRAVAQGSACTDGETRPCEPQAGVCIDSLQTCSGGEWQPCDAPGYQTLETFCDYLDNDCDGRVDIVDQDGDGSNACWVPGIENELFLTGLNEHGALGVFEYRGGDYREVWSTVTPDTGGASGGSEAGDLTGDGIKEIALARSLESTSWGEPGEQVLEFWSFDPQSAEWFLLWRSQRLRYPMHVGDIADFDGDGINEALISDINHQETNQAGLNVYSWDGEGFSIETTIQGCVADQGSFIGTAGDLDGDGTPEILYQCNSPLDIMVYEFDGEGYAVVASVPAPNNESSGNPMIVDDMETGDVNGDGSDDAVFCGNSGAAHVLTYRNGTYFVEYSSPAPTEEGVFSQTCSVGDMTNDGQNDILVINDEGAKVYSHRGSGYEEVWASPQWENLLESPPPIGGSFIGDADNDGFTEFGFLPPHVWETPVWRQDLQIFENDVVGASTFENTHRFGPMFGGAGSFIANLNPLNDEPLLADCDDHDPSRGAGEYCGADYSRPAAGSGGGFGGTRWSDEFTVCNTAAGDRELLFTFTERGAPGQGRRTHAETIGAGACVTYADPVQAWFGDALYGALLIDVMDGPAEDIRISGVFNGATAGQVLGQLFATTAVGEAVTGEAYILTTADSEANRLGTGFQAVADGTDLEITLENPIGTVHWRKVMKNDWRGGENDLITKLERKAPGVSNLVIHYRVHDGAVVPFGTVTDNSSGDPAARGPASPAERLVLPVIGKTSGAAGVDWHSEFLIANLTQQRNTVQLNLYLDRLLTGEINLGPGEALGYGDLVRQIAWEDSEDNPVALDEAVGALEIIAEDTVIVGSKFNSVDRETGRVMGLALEAMAEPNVIPGNEYLVLGVKNEDSTGVVRARLNFTNLTDEKATLSVDVLHQDGTLVGSFEKVARAKRFSDWRIPRSLTEEGGIYTLRVTSTQPGYAFLSQMNESNDAVCNYPLVVAE